MLEIILFIGIIWSAIGFGILMGMASSGEDLPFGADGFEFVNPVYIYKHCRVNVFGALVLMIIMSFICPFGTIFYWIYKLCTIGRKEDDMEDY